MKLTPTLGGAYSGSFGGLVASHNKGGAYFRRRSVPTDPASAGQLRVRQVFGELSQQWLTVLTAAQRLGWDEYAQAVSWTNTLGQTIQLSGINHYIRSNAPRLISQALFLDGFTAMAGTGRVDEPPTILELGVTPVIGNVTIDSLGTIDVDLSPIAGILDTVLFLQLSPGLNASTTFYKGPYFYVAGANDIGTVGVGDLADPTTPYSSRYTPPALGQVVFGQVRRSYNLDGARLSLAARFGPVVVV